MYRILLIDQQQEIEVRQAKPPHVLRVPNLREHIMIKYQGVTKICEVEDVWTNISLDSQAPIQGAVQVVVRWAKGLDPAVYVRRYR